jgi:Sec-independent protein translocase protein TatA
MMDILTVLNLVAVVLGTIVLPVAAYFIRDAKSDAREAKKEAKDVDDKLRAFQLHVAEHYATHPDLDRIEKTLLRIEDKLDGKADK